MNYTIKITKTEPNPNFAAELAKYEEREKYHYGNGPGEYPQSDIPRSALLCELTEEQFKAVKAAVFKTFE